MESTLQIPTVEANAATGKGQAIVYWVATALFCLEMGFTAFYMLAVLPAGAEAIARLGFPPYFRVELAWAKIIGVIVLLAPVPARVKEWAYAGFAINLVSAVIAHVAMGEGANSLVASSLTSVLWVLSYVSWRRR